MSAALRALLCGMVIASSACTAAERRVKVELPAEVDRVGIIVRSPSGERLGSTGIAPLDALEPLLAHLASGEEDRALVVGFSAASLEGLGAIDTIDVASPGDPSPWLPPALAAREVLPPDIVEDVPPPPIRAAELPACEPLPPLQLQLDCLVEGCAPTIMQNGCALAVDPGGSCGAGSFELHLGAPLVISSDRYSSCAELDPPEGALVAFRCAACTADLSPSEAPAPMTARSITLVPPASGPGEYLGEAAALGDRVLIAAYGGRPDGWFCTDPRPGSLHLIDLEREEAGDPIAAPPCPTQLVSAGDGWVGVFGAESRWLGFLDRSGALTSSVSLEGVRFVHRMVRAGDRLLITVTDRVTHDAEGSPGPTEIDLLSFDLATKSVVSRLRAIGTVVDLAAGRDLLAALDDEMDLATFYTLPDLVPRGSLSLAFDVVSIDYLRLEYDAESDQFLATSRGRRDGITHFRADERIGRTVTVGDRRIPTALGRWPADPRRMLVALRSIDGRDVALALFDPALRRILPGRAALGDAGAIRQIVAGERAAVAVHPVRGSITLIAPAP